MIEVTSYQYLNRYIETGGGTIPDEVQSISVSVDNGRISIYVNDKELFRSMSLTDGNVTITKEPT
jgi:hypothetical protein